MGAHGVALCGDLRKQLRSRIAAEFGDRWSTLRFGDPLLYAARRGPIADATAHERCLRGDGFGDGFGGDFLLVGRSTGGTSAPVLASAAPSAVGAPGSLRLRVAGSSPASGASQPSAPQSLSDAQFSPSGVGDGFRFPFGGRDGPRPVEHHTAAGSRRLAAEPRSRSASRKGGSPKSLLYSRLKCDASS